jgi:hypothetical protein
MPCKHVLKGRCNVPSCSNFWQLDPEPRTEFARRTAEVWDAIERRWKQYIADKAAADEHPDILDFFAWTFYVKGWEDRQSAARTLGWTDTGDEEIVADVIKNSVEDHDKTCQVHPSEELHGIDDGSRH